MAQTKKAVNVEEVTAQDADTKTEEIKTASVESVEEPKKTRKTRTKKEKEPAKKTAAAKKATTKTTTRTTAKKALESTVVLQFSGKEFTNEELVQIAKDVWKYDLKQKVGDLKSVKLYVKPEEHTVYYVINDDVTGEFKI